MTSIDLYIDFKSPAAYLALKPTRALIDESGVTVIWHPFDTRQRPLQEQKPDETRTETHFRVRERARRDTHLKYAGIQGVPMTFPPSPGETRCALAALLYVQHAPERFIDAAFRAYWVDQRDLDDPGVVRQLLEGAGYDGGGFDVDMGLQALVEAQREAEEAGVVDAPCYLIQGQVFLGREHMPWIKELIG